MKKIVSVSPCLCGLLLTALTTSSCGYALAGRGSFLPTTIRVVAIPQLVNRTTFFDVEQILTGIWDAISGYISGTLDEVEAVLSAALEKVDSLMARTKLELTTALTEIHASLDGEQRRELAELIAEGPRRRDYRSSRY